MRTETMQKWRATGLRTARHLGHPVIYNRTAEIMRIMVIGAAGQLAQDLLQQWREEQVLALTHDQLEITDAAAAARALEQFQPQLVVNTAAFHKVDDCED